MTSFTFSADDVDNLTVEGNSQLATINFAGLADDGTSTGAVISIKNNALVAASSKDAYDATPATTDTGTFDAGTSGMASLKTYLTHVIADNTSAIGVYFDTLEVVQSQAAAAGAYTDDTHTDSVTGNTRNAYAYQTAFVADTTPTVRETVSYLVPVITNSLFSNAAIANGEGFTIAYGGVTKSYLGVTTTLTTLAQLIASGITVSAAQDVGHRSLQTISLTNSAGSAGTVSTAGDIEYTFGTQTGVFPVGAGNNTGQIATAAAAIITGDHPSGTSYYATVSGSALVVHRVISNTVLYDQGPSTHTYPVLTLLTTASFTTAELVGNAASTGATLNSDYFVGVTTSDLKDLRITIKNNSTAVALSHTITSNGTSTGLDLLNSFQSSSFAALASGTTMTGDAAYSSAFADISTPGSGTAATTKNRLSWL